VAGIINRGVVVMPKVGAKVYWIEYASNFLLNFRFCVL
jgi:hypothetical protein